MPFKITTEKLNNVKSHIYAGESTTNIVTATGVSKSTVNLMKRKINPNYTRQSAGRRPLVPSSAQNIIRLKLRSGQLRCLEGVRSYLGSIGHLVGYHATRNFVKKLGFKCEKKSNTAALNFIQMRQRYQWARRHQYWTFQDWKKVIFSDESRFNLWGSDGVEYTYQYKGDSKKPFNYKTKRKQGGGSMIVWGCMTALGPDYACRLLEKSMNSDLYQYVLGTTYLDTLRYYGLHHDDVIFQQDGATCHTSNPTYQ
jgi:transposase